MKKICILLAFFVITLSCKKDNKPDSIETVKEKEQTLADLKKTLEILHSEL